MIRISKRLDAIYDLVPQDSTLVDVGTDHGWLIINAVQSGRVKRAYGLDIAEGPLKQAYRHIQKAGFEDKITLMKMDGLSDFHEQANVFVIAGMGAQTIWSIVDGYQFKVDDCLILQSNTDVPWLRETLVNHGFCITNERFLFDKGKPVFILVCSLGNQSLNTLDIYAGPILRQHISDAYGLYIEQRIAHLSDITAFNEVLREEYMVLKQLSKTESESI